MGTLHTFTPRTETPPMSASVGFSRAELSQLLSVYSRRVISGEWRDYAIDRADDLAMFSIFKNTRLQPLFSIVKRGGEDARVEFALFSGPELLERGPSLPEILTALESRPHLVPALK